MLIIHRVSHHCWRQVTFFCAKPKSFYVDSIRERDASERDEEKKRYRHVIS